MLDFAAVGVIAIRQVRSATRTADRRRVTATLIGLGLGKVGKLSILKDTPEVRGMINKIPHMVLIENDTGARTTRSTSRVRSENDKFTPTRHLDSKSRTTAASFRVEERYTPLRRLNDDVVSDRVRERVVAFGAASRSYQLDRNSGTTRRAYHEHLTSLLDHMYEGKPADALHAAYAVLKNSPKYANDIPNKGPEKWASTDAERFRATLERFLSKSDRELTTTIQARQKGPGKDGLAIIVIHVVSRSQLPFKLNDEPVMLSQPGRSFHFGKLRIGCELATSRSSVRIDGKPAGDGVVLDAEVTFEIPNDVLGTSIPISVFSREFQMVEEVALG